MANSERTESSVLEKEDAIEPGLYKVLMHNDDVTTMDFVVDVLRRVFHKSQSDAEEIMLTVHNTGVGLCGIYTKEVAESKIAQVRRDARLASFPLQCTMEKD